MNGAPLPALTGEEESSGVVRPADPILNQIYGHILEQADRPEELAKRLLPLLQSYYDSSAVTAQYYRTRNAAPIVDLVIERIKQQGTISAPLKPSTAYRGSTRLRQRGYFGSIRASVHGPEFKDFLTPFEDEFKADNIEIDGNTGKKIYTGTYTFEAQDTFEAPVDDFTQNIPGKKEKILNIGTSWGSVKFNTGDFLKNGKPEDTIRILKKKADRCMYAVKYYRLIQDILIQKGKIKNGQSEKNGLGVPRFDEE